MKFENQKHIMGIWNIDYVQVIWNTVVKHYNPLPPPPFPHFISISS